MVTAAFTRDAIYPATVSVEAKRSRQKRSPSVKVAIVHEHVECIRVVVYIECARTQWNLSPSLFVVALSHNNIVTVLAVILRWHTDSHAQQTPLQNFSARCYICYAENTCKSFTKFTGRALSNIRQISDQHPWKDPHYLFDSSCIAHAPSGQDCS